MSIAKAMAKAMAVKVIKGVLFVLMSKLNQCSELFSTKNSK